MSNRHLFMEIQEQEFYLDQQNGEVVPHDYMTEPEPKPEPNMFGALLKFFKNQLAKVQIKDNSSFAEHIHEQENIEKSSTWIQNQITNCHSIEHLESLQRMIDNLPIIYRGEKTMVNSWVDSLNMQLYLKHKQLTKC